MKNIFGPRVRVDLRIPRELHEAIHNMCERIGIPKNAFFVFSASILLSRLHPTEDEKKMIKAMMEEVVNYPSLP